MDLANARHGRLCCALAESPPFPTSCGLTLTNAPWASLPKWCIYYPDYISHFIYKHFITLFFNFLIHSFQGVFIECFLVQCARCLVKIRSIPLWCSSSPNRSNPSAKTHSLGNLTGPYGLSDSSCSPFPFSSISKSIKNLSRYFIFQFKISRFHLFSLWENLNPVHGRKRLPLPSYSRFRQNCSAALWSHLQALPLCRTII